MSIFWMFGRVLGGLLMSLTNVLVWWGLLGAAFVIFSLIAGSPHVLFTYEYRGSGKNRTYVWCDYYGVLGRIEARAGQEVPETCPVIALIDLGDRLDELLGKRMP